MFFIYFIPYYPKKVVPAQHIFSMFKKYALPAGQLLFNAGGIPRDTILPFLQLGHCKISCPVNRNTFSSMVSLRKT